MRNVAVFLSIATASIGELFLRANLRMKCNTGDYFEPRDSDE